MPRCQNRHNGQHRQSERPQPEGALLRTMRPSLELLRWGWRRYRRRSRFAIFLHRSNETITSPRDSLDVLAPVRAIAQHLPQIEDMASQIAFLDENTRPHFLQ